MTHKYKSKIINLLFLLIALSSMVGCDCKGDSKPNEPKGERNVNLHKEEKLDLQANDQLIGTDKLQLQIINNGLETVDLQQYRLKIQVIEAVDSTGKPGEAQVSIDGSKGISIVGDFQSGPNGIVATPSAISVGNASQLKPNDTATINLLIITYTAVKAKVKCTLEPRNPNIHQNAPIIKEINWEIGNKIGPVVGESKVDFKVADKVELIKEGEGYIVGFNITIENISEHYINLKKISYNYKIKVNGVDKVDDSFNGEELNKKDVFMAPKELSKLPKITTTLSNMTKQQAETWLKANKLSLEFSASTLDGSYQLGSRTQDILDYKKM